MRMDPTHQSDSRAKLIRTPDANNTPLIEDHRQPGASSGAVPDYQTTCHERLMESSDGHVQPLWILPLHLEVAGPRFSTCARSAWRPSAAPFPHRPSSCGSLGSFRSVVFFFPHATSRQYYLSARRYPGPPRPPTSCHVD